MAKEMWIDSRKFTNLYDLSEAIQGLSDLAGASDIRIAGGGNSANGVTEILLYKEIALDGKETFNAKIYIG
jgi:hypothetical protein